MKEIKEEIQKVETHIYYEALDGTKFKTSEECMKYEETARCVVKTKIKDLIVTKECNAWELMGGYEDNDVFGVKVPTEKEADLLKQSVLLDCPYLKENENARKKLFDKIDSAIGDIFIIGINCDEEWYAINSRRNIINNLNNMDKKEE